MRGTAARRQGGGSQSVDVTARVDELEDAVSEDVTVPVASDDAPDVLVAAAAMSMQRSRIRSSTRSSSSISRSIRADPTTFSGSPHPTRPFEETAGQSISGRCPDPAGRFLELSGGACVSERSESSGGDMLHPLLLLLLLVAVVADFDEASPVAAVTDTGINSRSRPASSSPAPCH